MDIYKIAHLLNKEHEANSSMAIGKKLMHPDGYMVEIIGGTFLDQHYGRVTNFWSWKRINEDGSLNSHIENGYGW